MGFFSGIKKAFSHGGVKVALQAPNSASLMDASLSVTATITATDTPQTINSVTFDITSEMLDKDGMATNPHIMSKAVYDQPFSLAVGETKEIPMAIPLNVSGMADHLPEAAQAFAGVLSKVQTAIEAVDRREYRYTVNATADVEGIKLDPADGQLIQLLKPGEFGVGNFQVKL